VLQIEPGRKILVDTGIRIPVENRLIAALVGKQDSSCFVLKAKQGRGLRVGQLKMWERHVKLVISPEMPRDVVSILCADLPKRVVVKSLSKVVLLNRVGKGWRRTILSTVPPDLDDASAAFDRVGRRLCLILQSRLLVNSNQSVVTVFKLSSRAGAREVRWSMNKGEDLYPTKAGWTLASDGEFVPINESPKPHLGKPSILHGNLVPVPPGYDPAMISGGVVSWNGRPYGNAPINAAVLQALCFLPGIGPIYIQDKRHVMVGGRSLDLANVGDYFVRLVGP
jgi:hypothetical protein